VESVGTDVPTWRPPVTGSAVISEVKWPWRPLATFNWDSPLCGYEFNGESSRVDLMFSARHGDVYLGLAHSPLIFSADAIDRVVLRGSLELDQ
jgi:hypothetical protein